MNRATLVVVRRDVFSRTVLAFFFFLLIPSLVVSQSFRGSIRGKVTDPSGGLIPGAKITAKNTGTGLLRDVVSNDEGTGSLSGGLVSPYFLALASGEGMTWSAADMEKSVRDAGFARVERFADLGFSHALVVGHK